MLPNFEAFLIKCELLTAPEAEKVGLNTSERQHAKKWRGVLQ